MDAVIAATDHQTENCQSSVNEAENIAKRRARSRIACELLLARLFRNHPDHAMAALQGIEPRIVDLEPPEPPANNEPPPPNYKVVVLPLRTRASDAKLVGASLTDMSLILQKVASFYELSVVAICSPSRLAPVLRARQIAYYLARIYTTLPPFDDWRLHWRSGPFYGPPLSRARPISARYR